MPEEIKKPDVESKALHFQNFVKGPITSIIGAVIIALSAYHSIEGSIEWVWNGLIGCGVGGILIFTPDSIKQIVDAVIKKKTS